MMWGAGAGAGAVISPCVSLAPTTSTSRGRISSNCSVFSSNSAGTAPFHDFPLASRIVVRNLSYTTTETSIRKKFSNFGQVAEVSLPKEGNGEKSRGYAFVQYTSQDDALLALENMDQQLIDGRIVRVEIAKLVNYAPRCDYPRTSGPPKKQNS
ncbi:hypothetical protein Scep_027237 [Stephania cephalantha]|uniref:RRM domain-containing protein n=1 Tax=Stephania cephalantha TaxID=152367 RepID=A0AAP0HMD7_9MAGN